MKKLSIRLLIYACFMLALASCQKEEAIVPSTEETPPGEGQNEEELLASEEIILLSSISEILFRKDGKILNTQKQFFEYNDSSQLIKRTHYTTQSDTTKMGEFVEHYTYDDSGNLEWTTFDSGNTDDGFFYSWGENDKISKVDCFWAGELVHYMILEYPTEKTVRSLNYTGEGIFVGKMDFELDNAQNVTRRTEYDENDEPRFKVEFQYDYNGINPYSFINKLHFWDDYLSTQYFNNNLHYSAEFTPENGVCESGVNTFTYEHQYSDEGLLEESVVRFYQYGVEGKIKKLSYDYLKNELPQVHSSRSGFKVDFL